MRRLIGIFWTPQFVRFLVVGGIAATVNFFSRFFFQMFCPYYTVNVALAFCAGTVVSFALNRFYSFKAFDDHRVHQFVKFLISTGGAILVASAVAWCCMRLYYALGRTLMSESQARILAHLAAIGLTTIYNFLHMKFFSFKKLGVAEKIKTWGVARRYPGGSI